MGANHNFYNEMWDPNIVPFEAYDDWEFSLTGNEVDGPLCQPTQGTNERLTSIEQQGTLIATASAFFRSYLKSETAFLPFLRGDALPPASAKTDEIYVAYTPKDDPAHRLDVNPYTSAADAAVNPLNGSASGHNLAVYEFCDDNAPMAPAGCLADPGGSLRDGRAPHTSNGFDVTQLRIAWEGDSYTSRLTAPYSLAAFIAGSPYVENELPAGYRDVSSYRALQFRAFVDFTDSRNPFRDPQDLSIELEDGAGVTEKVTVSDHSSSLVYPPSVQDHAAVPSYLPIPRAVLNTVRVPLSAFTQVHLTDIRYIRLVFDQTSSGAINIADLAFADPASNLTPDVTSSVDEPVLTAGGDKLENVGLDVIASDDQPGNPAIDVFVYSDEDDLDTQANQSSPDAKDIAPGTLRLRAERDNAGDGRVYVILAIATDAQGAKGHSCTTVTVPDGNGAQALADVTAEASAAAELCTGFSAAAQGLAAVPDGFFVVGDGPVEGANQ